MLITAAYRDMNAELHKTRADYGSGNASRKWYGHIKQFMGVTSPETILDYGCGKRAFAASMPHLLIDNYDPAIPGFDAPPEPSDFVVCMDVMEHIEPDLLDNVLDDLQRVTKRGIFLAIASGAANKILSDGRNAHLIQHGPDWWLPKIMARWDLLSASVYRDEFTVFALVNPDKAMKALAA